MLGLLICSCYACTLLVSRIGNKRPCDIIREGNICIWTIGITNTITNLLKCYIGAFRPNFYDGCEFNVARATCDIEYNYGRHSFPSGHSSLSVSCILIVSLILKLHVKQVLHPACDGLNVISIWICATRINDNHHFAVDVLAGALIGYTVAIACFRTYHSPPKDTSPHQNEEATIDVAA